MSTKPKTSNDFGLSREVIEKTHQVFRNHPTVQKAVLYRSRALGTFRPNSDIDLTLVGEKPTFTEQLKID
ncbi:nucleotidyltransferase domain-containing protein [Algoriphagus resistens]|uniref:nucleotidyltransferase domain-containing protein n=1 Tax=Algoriphagus resistens TaxID=1750590 RepID=UPI0007167F3B|nr:nucleotidyltransferase domain-containing protein [Algoriphagus resistens]